MLLTSLPVSTVSSLSVGDVSGSRNEFGGGGGGSGGFGSLGRRTKREYPSPNLSEVVTTGWLLYAGC